MQKGLGDGRETNVDVAPASIGKPFPVRSRVESDLSADLNEGSQLADGNVNHGAVHAWAKVLVAHLQRDRDVGEGGFRNRVAGIELEKPLDIWILLVPSIEMVIG